MILKKTSKIYDKNDIFGKLDQLKITREGNNILTNYHDKLISNSLVTKKYELFDFPTFAKTVIDEVENYFTPETYRLSITGGRQELRLVGEEVLINGDRYSKMFNILNSTDKSRALQLNVGLLRFVCTNGMVVGVDGEYSGLRTKHFKSSLSEKVEVFTNSLSDFDLNINRQSETIEKLQGRFVSFKELAAKIALDENGVIKANTGLKLRAFANKLINSETDKLINLNSDQITLLKNANFFINPEFKNVDIEMSAYSALNCWTEVYREYDSSVLRRETSRILELV